MHVGVHTVVLVANTLIRSTNADARSPTHSHIHSIFTHPFVIPYTTLQYPSQSSLPGASRIGSRAFILRLGTASPRKKTRKVPCACNLDLDLDRDLGPALRRTSPAHLVVVLSTIPYHIILPASQPASQSTSVPSICSIAAQNQSDRLFVCARAHLPGGILQLHHPSWLPARASRKPTSQHPTTPTLV
jgi:hypothetical protein